MSIAASEWNAWSYAYGMPQQLLQQVHGAAAWECHRLRLRTQYWLYCADCVPIACGGRIAMAGGREARAGDRPDAARWRGVQLCGLCADCGAREYGVKLTGDVDV